MKKKIALLCLFISSSMFCAGCNNDVVITEHTEQTEISFSWWGNDTRNSYTLEAIAQFEELHPEIKVNCIYSEWSGYQTRNDIQMAANTEADVMQINYAWIQGYSSDGLGYYDLYQLADIIDLTAFSQEELSFGLLDDKLNALPIALNTQTIYINKTIYEQYGLEVPSTWDDLFAAAEVMNGEVYPLSMAPKGAWFLATSYVEQKSGRKIISDNGTLEFSDDDIRMMLEFYCKLIDKKVIPQVEYFDRLEFDKGNYAGIMAWLSDASNYCKGAEENGYEVVIADYLTDSIANVGEGWYAKPATMYSISKNTDHPKESALLLEYLLNSNEMADKQGIEKGIPLSDKAQQYLIENEKLTGIQYSAFLKLNQYAENISVISPFYEDSEMLDAFQNACISVYYEKEDINIASAELRETLISRLKKLK